MNPTCFTCGEPTNTVLYFSGNGQWLVACLMAFDIHPDQATVMVSKLLECDPDAVFDYADHEDFSLFCCGGCAAKAKFRPPVPPGTPGHVIAQKTSG
ncbi:hypothetical protein ABZT51_36120 [Streptomyces sp. NPDC005373]|uniref:hypothetical protein n=1 Tax=Streptomyces sp. NPDC005373 TaxID=3156879 RepID=UPI0033B7FB82